MKSAKTRQLARALVEVGRDNDCFSQLVEDLKSVHEKLGGSPDANRYLSDKQVGFEKKQDALKHIFQDFVSAKTYNFLFLLIKSQKFKSLDEIVDLAEKLNKEVSGVVEVIIESARPIKPEQEEQIRQIVNEKLKQDILNKPVINEKLLAGICLRAGDTVIDASLYGKMMRLKQRIEAIE